MKNSFTRSREGQRYDNQSIIFVAYTCTCTGISFNRKFTVKTLNSLALFDFSYVLIEYTSIKLKRNVKSRIY